MCFCINENAHIPLSSNLSTNFSNMIFKFMEHLSFNLANYFSKMEIIPHTISILHNGCM